MAEDRRLDSVQITVDGQALPADQHQLLQLVRVEESVQLPDAFTLRFDDPHFELFDRGAFRLGSRVEIAFRAEGEEPVIVTTGEVTAIAVEPGPGGRHELVLTGLDAAHRLARGPKSRSFLQMTDTDIVAQIASEHGLDTDVEATSEVHDYVLQANETDYAFASRLARRIGFDFWVSGDTLHFRERPSANGAAPTLRWGDNLQTFKMRYASSERCDEVTVRGWDPVGKRTVLGRASEGDRGSTAPAAEELAVDARAAFGAISRCAGQFPVASEAEADELAHALLAKASGGEVLARGVSVGDPLIAAGSEVTVERMGQRLSGTYRLTSVEHVYRAGSPYRTRFECGAKEPSSLIDLARSGIGHAEDRKGWGSLVVGVVTNCDDPERLGRVKVKFPSLTDDDESTWARVVAPGGGPERGLQCLPEVGDEVLVGFELDDKHRPLVLGGLWNRDDALPDADTVVDGEVTARVWHSRNAHHLELRDEPEGTIVLALGDGDSELRLTSPESSLHGERKLEITAQEIEVRADRSLTLKAPQIAIEGDSEVKVSGGVIRLN